MRMMDTRRNISGADGYEFHGLSYSFSVFIRAVRARNSFSILNYQFSIYSGLPPSSSSPPPGSGSGVGSGSLPSGVEPPEVVPSTMSA